MLTMPVGFGHIIPKSLPQNSRQTGKLITLSALLPVISVLVHRFSWHSKPQLKVKMFVFLMNQKKIIIKLTVGLL